MSVRMRRKCCVGRGGWFKKYDWGNTVVHYNVSNLGHDWPSSFPNLGTDKTTCGEADATRVILNWFGKWRLQG